MAFAYSVEFEPFAAIHGDLELVPMTLSENLLGIQVLAPSSALSLILLQSRPSIPVHTAAGGEPQGKEPHLYTPEAMSNAMTSSPLALVRPLAFCLVALGINV